MLHVRRDEDDEKSDTGKIQVMHKSAGRPRAVLTAPQVVAIFQYRAFLRSSSKVSRMYGVSEKTIRDIWMGRTWKAATRHLDPLRPLEVQHADRAHGVGTSHDNARESHPTRAKVSAEEAGWPFTESSEAGSQEKNSLDPGYHALSGIEQVRLSTKPKNVDLLHAWKQAGNQAWQHMESDWPSPNQSIDDLLFDWEQAGRISMR
jgi:hypothetical protein